MQRSIPWALIPASALILAGCGIQHPAPNSSVPHPAHHRFRPKPSPKERPTPKTLPSAQTPKVGSSTTTTKTVGNTTTITKTTIVGSTSTSTLIPLKSDALPVTNYAIGLTFTSIGASPLAAFDRLWTTRHHTPPALPVPLNTITVPWAKGTQWTILPEAIPDPEAGGNIFWAGVSTTPDHWTWIPSDTANNPNPHLPLPLHETMQWAQDLALNGSGPNAPMGGNIPWASVTGTVQMPIGWSWASFNGSINLFVWDPSEKYADLYYAPWTIWSAHNATTGNGSLDQITPDHGTLAQVLR
jgi:hypothetical protein